jgi:hypothetical protein
MCTTEDACVHGHVVEGICAEGVQLWWAPGNPSFRTQAFPKVLHNQGSMSLYIYIYSYFIRDHWYTTFYTSVRCSRYQGLPQCTNIIIERLLYFMLCTYSLMHGLPDADLWQTETCWRCADPSGRAV